jgi:hypothetical protein
MCTWIWTFLCVSFVRSSRRQPAFLFVGKHRVPGDLWHVPALLKYPGLPQALFAGQNDAPGNYVTGTSPFNALTLFRSYLNLFWRYLDAWCYVDAWRYIDAVWTALWCHVATILTYSCVHICRDTTGVCFLVELSCSWKVCDTGIGSFNVVTILTICWCLFDAIVEAFWSATVAFFFDKHVARGNLWPRYSTCHVATLSWRYFNVILKFVWLVRPVFFDFTYTQNQQHSISQELALMILLTRAFGFLPRSDLTTVLISHTWKVDFSLSRPAASPSTAWQSLRI